MELPKLLMEAMESSHKRMPSACLLGLGIETPLVLHQFDITFFKATLGVISICGSFFLVFGHIK
jgi:hypothetical protein